MNKLTLLLLSIFCAASPSSAMLNNSSHSGYPSYAANDISFGKELDQSIEKGGYREDIDGFFKQNWEFIVKEEYISNLEKTPSYGKKSICVGSADLLKVLNKLGHRIQGKGKQDAIKELVEYHRIGLNLSPCIMIEGLPPSIYYLLSMVL